VLRAVPAISTMFDAIGAASDRTVELVVENLSGLKLNFGGEWFESGGWAKKRVAEIDKGAKVSLRFENATWVTGCSGYVYYHSEDHSRTLFLTFSNPIATEARFTARGGRPVAMKEVFGSMPVVNVSPTSAPYLAEGCAFQRLPPSKDTEGGKLQIFIVVLPEDAKKLPEKVQKWTAKGVTCESEAAANFAVSDPSAVPQADAQGLTERYFTVEVNNRSKETFIFDGEFFEAGGWWKNAKPKTILPESQSVVYCYSDDYINGLQGVFWFVNSSTKDIYFSVALSNPITSECSFWASAGGPPSELQSKFGYVGKAEAQRVKGSECIWKVPDIGYTCKAEVTINPQLQRMDPLAYGQKAEEAPPPPPAEEVQKTSSETALALIPEGKSDEDKAVEDMGKLWDQSRPKDVFDGLGQGLKAVGGGVVAGLASAVAAPVVGASENGFRGFAGGLATGVVGAVVCTVGGAVMGATQVARGIANTPEAFMQDKNRVWDAQKGCWVDDTVDLRSEMEEVFAEDSSDDSADEGRSHPATSSASQPSKVVVDRDFYDQIGVEPSASASEIKKAYYKAALKVHPDKNQGDPAAHQKFQDLAKAYQVLSDPALRAKYDKQGKQAVQTEEPDFKPELFFGMLFGSEKFEKYVGKMYLGTQVKKVIKIRGDDTDGDSLRSRAEDTASEDRTQRRREIKLAKHMLEKLDQFVTKRDEVGFQKATMLEAIDLLKVSFGVHMLRTLGEVYEDCGVTFFDTSAVGRYRREWRDSAYKTGQTFTVFSSVVKSLVAARQISQTVKEGEEAPSMEGLEGSLPVFLQTAWEMSKMDVQSTAKAVCGKLLKDISVPWQLRVRRAMALQLLGRIFVECSQAGNLEDADPEVAKRQLEEALMNMAMKSNMKGEQVDKVPR